MAVPEESPKSGIGKFFKIDFPEKIKKFKQPSEKKLEKQRKKLLIPKDSKLKRAKKSPNVLIVNPKALKKDPTWMRIFHVFSDTFYEYADITKVNGMYYLRRGVTSGALRVLWSFIMIGLFSFAISLVYLLYRRFVESPTRVTIAPSFSIEQIPFPGFTICHPQS